MTTPLGTAEHFLRDAVRMIPANKLFVFGSDFAPVELVVGHAAMTRRGMTNALANLVEKSWISECDLPELVKRLMRRNVHEAILWRLASRDKGEITAANSAAM